MLRQVIRMSHGMLALPHLPMRPVGPAAVALRGPTIYQERWTMDRDEVGRLLIGQDAKMVAISEVIRRSARSTVPVWITGELGTGKARIARAVHSASHRADQPFITVHCGVLPEPLLARELFGYEPKTAPGLGRWLGAFERAQGGTLFLEEIGRLPPGLQLTLLRVLQERIMARGGGQSPIPVDVRVVTSTSTEVPPLVYAGQFRAELYYRLQVVSLDVPPLRARRGDIPLLVHAFLTCATRPASHRAPSISPAAMDTLQAYDWPGSVQELEDLIQRLIVGTPHACIQWQDLPWEVHAGPTPPQDSRAEDADPSRPAESPFGPAALRQFLARRPWN
jgi:DNA-binding NtrC family response regulator